MISVFLCILTRPARVLCAILYLSPCVNCPLFFLVSLYCITIPLIISWIIILVRAMLRAVPVIAVFVAVVSCVRMCRPCLVVSVLQCFSLLRDRSRVSRVCVVHVDRFLGLLSQAVRQSLCLCVPPSVLLPVFCTSAHNTRNMDMEYESS